MITSTFIFLDKISAKTEQNIWKQGITDWTKFFNTPTIRGISKKRKLYYDMQLLKAQKALYNLNSEYFTALPSAETWRLYDFFRDDAVFLDIEAYDESITVLSLFDGIETKVMVKDINFDPKILQTELEKYKLLVTFNGSSFDIPFLRKKYSISTKMPHIDLRHACARLGLTGGLKEIEKKLGIKRNNPIVERMYGGDPACLWRMFKGSGDDYYLKLLIEYNEEDVINLKQIANHVVEKLKWKLC